MMSVNEGLAILNLEDTVITGTYQINSTSGYGINL
jgi:hypothetical protein